jgi:hypothetical protein
MPIQILVGITGLSSLNEGCSGHLLSRNNLIRILGLSGRLFVCQSFGPARPKLAVKERDKLVIVGLRPRTRMVKGRSPEL